MRWINGNKSPQNTSLLALLLDPWLIAIAFFSAIVLFVICLSLLWLTKPGPRQATLVTAVVRLIPAPTATPALPTPTSTPFVTSTPISSVPPSPAPGVISIGATVQIQGTGGDGLRLRADPGLAADVRILGAEAEVFQVKDGPRQADGYTWWLLEGLYDPARRGWAVSNYLGIVQNP